MPRGYYIETIIHCDDNFEDAEKTLPNHTAKSQPGQYNLWI